MVACSREAPQVSAADASADPRAKLVDDTARAIEAHYVFPDMGAAMVDALRTHQAHGDYAAVADDDELARLITKDLREVSRDRHMMLEHGAVAQGRGNGPQGIGTIERLSGNVAHVVIDSLVTPRAVVTSAMTQVADADALILDLRSNHGGDPSLVAFLASYLFGPEPVHLNDIFWHDSGTTDSFWTLRDIPGQRFGPEKPVLVLTSAETFSAAEELAYDLQALGRAIVVGETTGGGAHPVAVEALGSGFTVRVPTGRAINPVTKTSWEGVGVKPDVATPAPSALDVAHERAVQALLDASPKGGKRHRDLQILHGAFAPR